MRTASLCPGWSGNTLSIGSCDDDSVLVSGLTVTSAQGYGHSELVCLPPVSGVQVSVGGGTWTSEISWVITHPDGTTVTSGSGEGVVSGCSVTPSPTPTVPCEDYSIALVDEFGDGACV